MSTQLQVKSDTVPANFCFQGFNTSSWPELVGLLHVDTEDTDAITISQNPPAPSLRSKPWLKLDTDGKPLRIYYYVGGLWLARHPILSGLSMIYTGAVAGIPYLENLDGDITPTLTHGPFWEKLSNFDGRFLVGAGTIPDALTVVTPLSQGGVGTVTLDITQIPAHKHSPNDGSSTFFGNNPTAYGTTFPMHGSSSTSGYFATETVGGGLAHSNVPPFCGLSVIRRTIREYMRG